MSRGHHTIAALLLAVAAGVQAAAFDHASWSRVLQAHVSEIGEVDYAAIKANRKDLDDYIRLLGEVSPANRPELFPARSHELAYWINAYNAFVTRGVVDAYPTRGVRDLGALYGFFRRKDSTAGGVKMSLLHLEDDILRKKYRDPRIHFAIVCASLSCPFLAREPFLGDKLEDQLERAARAFVNQRRNLTIDAAANQVTLAAVYDLRDYRGDFEQPQGPGGARTPLLDYVRRYAGEEYRRALDSLQQPRIKFYDYDWSINDPGSRARSKNPLERELAKRPRR